MKRIFTPILGLLVSFSVSSQSVTNFSANGATGFGNAIGGSTLSVTEDATYLTFTLIKGTGNFDDALVLYLDVVNGGENSNTSYTDMTDGSRRAISGLSNGGKAPLFFPSGFGADFAIAAAPSNTFAGLYALNNTGNFTYVQSAELSPLTAGSPVFTFRVLKSNIGFGGRLLASFTFFGTYLNSSTGSTYRSNEGYGVFSFAGAADAKGNPGYNETTVVSALNYPAQVLPVKLLSFSGNVVDSKGKLTWQVANDDEVSRYELQKSTDGKNYSTLQTIAALRTSAVQNYSVEDVRLAGTNLYRLKTTDDKGVVTYSKVVQLSTGTKGQGFTIFPNPVQQTLNLKMAKLDKGYYNVNVYSTSGQLVFTKAISYDGSGNTLQVELPANLQRGNYSCILSSNAGKFTSSFLKQ